MTNAERQAARERCAMLPQNVDRGWAVSMAGVAFARSSAAALPAALDALDAADKLVNSLCNERDEKEALLLAAEKRIEALLAWVEIVPHEAGCKMVDPTERFVLYKRCNCVKSNVPRWVWTQKR